MTKYELWLASGYLMIGDMKINVYTEKQKGDWMITAPWFPKGSKYYISDQDAVELMLASEYLPEHDLPYDLQLIDVTDF